MQEARLEFRDCQNQMKQARLDVERLLAECAQAYGELPEPFRQRVSPTPPSDWLATTNPVGTCVMRTAVSTLFTFCPPFPPER